MRLFVHFSTPFQLLALEQGERETNENPKLSYA
jgi:hypothetical protein